MVNQKKMPHCPRSRTQLSYRLHPFDDGAICVYLSSVTYPEIFELNLSHIFSKAPNGWGQNPDKPNQKYLWFPLNGLTPNEIEEVEAWGAAYQQYVVLGLNRHTSGYFSGELDFCLALSFNRDTRNFQQRTRLDEARYQAKYGGGESVEHDRVLIEGLQNAYEYLPIPSPPTDRVISYIPCPPGEMKLQKRLAEELARRLNLPLAPANLRRGKPPLKNIPVEQKIPVWQSIFSTRDGVELGASVRDKTVVVVDDLYQSGATMWCYAQFLKNCGASYVIGLVCVKSLRNSDNQ
ncbi:MAG: hypothetical protein GMKNLPBB_02735 [Myxococcota bacterium]|nr:hypothetical protein [Myxococcota bacterium]